MGLCQKKISLQDSFFFFFLEFEKFASVTNKVKDIPIYTPTFYHVEYKQMINLTCLTIIKSYIKPFQ